jgi:putative chitinase
MLLATQILPLTLTLHRVHRASGASKVISAAVVVTVALYVFAYHKGLKVKLNSSIIVIGTGCTESIASQWVDALNAACEQCNITSEPALAAFLANVGVESGSLTSFVEGMNYSAQGLANQWPNRYSVDPKSTVKVPNALAIELNRKPVAIANNCYANRNGNGNEESGDGWSFRGHGPIQISGRANFKACHDATGLDAVNDPECLTEPVGGALSSAWFFAARGCIAMAESGNFSGVVKAINGSVPSATNKGPLRTSRFLACRKALYAL